MKNQRLAIRGLLFAAVFLALHAAARQVYLEKIAYFTTACYVDRLFHENQSEITTLFMGDSQMQFGIDPTLIDAGAFNFAQAGETLPQTYYKLRHILLETDCPLRTVVLNIGPDSLSRKRLDLEANQAYYARYVDYPELARIRGSLLATNLAVFSDRWFPYAGGLRTVFEYAETDKQGLRHFWENYLAPHRGFSPGRQGTKEEFWTFPTSEPIDRLAEPPWFENEGLVYLDKLALLCKNEDISLVVVIMPLPRCYMERAANTVPIEEFPGRLAQALASNAGVGIINYMSAFQDRNALFYDMTHLNEDGVRLLCADLRKRLETMEML